MSHLFIFTFVAFAFGVKPKNLIAKTSVKKLIPYAFLQMFMVFGFIF